ncbi:MAG: RtcB family protein [Candidatus Delongbacteria bacterium]
MKVIKTSNLPIYSWAASVETGAMKQAEDLAALPFLASHVALMPDCHEGYGMPIGGVIASKDHIIPNAVGVDIGCGMCAVRTTLTSVCREELKLIMDQIRKRIPLGFNHQREKKDISLMPDPKELEPGMVCLEQFEDARKQIGTLGGGNHFIEIQKGSDGHIWIMVHSGSRNLGKRVADHYNAKAKELCSAGIKIPKDLAYLPADSFEAQNYLIEMNYCVRFAYANRKEMMNQICSSFTDTLGDLEFGDMINIAHNYASKELQYGEEVFVHRKGATSARKGETGIIPGSQGSKSYIVIGLGNPKSFTSCSHGAGRRMGRNEAKRSLDLEAEIKRLDDQGIIHGMMNRNDLDEAAGAYKDIDQVMNAQKDLVEIIVELSPVAVVKG